MAPSLPTQVETTPKAEQNVPMPDAAETEPTLPPLPAQAGTGQAVPEVIGLQYGPQWSDTVARARAARGLPPTEVVAASLLATTVASQPEPAEPTSAAAAPPAVCKPCGSIDVRMKTGVFVDPSAAASVATLTGPQKLFWGICGVISELFLKLCSSKFLAASTRQMGGVSIIWCNAQK